MPNNQNHHPDAQTIDADRQEKEEDARRLLSVLPSDTAEIARTFWTVAYGPPTQAGNLVRSAMRWKEGVNPSLTLQRLCANVDVLNNDRALYLKGWVAGANSQQNPVRDAARAFLNRRNESQREMAERSIATSSFTGVVAWRMVLGMGDPNPLETSIRLHPQYGFPYLPGSSIKGVARHFRLREIAKRVGILPISGRYYHQYFDAKQQMIKPTPLLQFESFLCGNPEQKQSCLENLRRTEGPMLKQMRAAIQDGSEASALSMGVAEIEERTAAQRFRDIFGTTNHKGQVDFLDAIPEKWSYILDIVNPHYSDYYGGGGAPSDWSEPIPVHFVTLAQGTKMNFACQSRTESLAIDACGCVQIAIKKNGVGAKTNAGYGEIV